MTILARLLAFDTDLGGYTTFVFECLDAEVREQTKYVMCTKFPNWEQSPIAIDDIGYLEIKEVQAGWDKWFDGEKMVPYKYNGIHFIKFIKKPEKEDKTYVM